MIIAQRTSASLLHSLRYTFIPPSCYDINVKPNPVISVAIGNTQTVYCNLSFRLFENVVPKTAENYKRLLLGNGRYQSRNLSLIGSPLTRLVNRSFIQIGSMEEGNCSIFGPKFRDESFELYHDRPGLLTSISEQNTNNCRFAITVAPCPFMDLKNIVFGEVTNDTMNNLRALQRLGAKMLDLRILSSQLIEQQNHN